MMPTAAAGRVAIEACGTCGLGTRRVDLIVIREWPRAADAGDPGEQGRPLELTSCPGPNLASHSYVAPVSKLMTMKLM